jgi:hypothetical protein
MPARHCIVTSLNCTSPARVRCLAEYRGSGTKARISTASNLWDDIVIGAGSAGCIVAARLSENTSRRVLLLEAGPRDVWLMKPFGLSYYLDFSRFEWGDSEGKRWRELGKTLNITLN